MPGWNGNILYVKGFWCCSL